MDALKKYCPDCDKYLELAAFYASPTCKMGVTKRCKKHHLEFVNRKNYKVIPPKTPKNTITVELVSSKTIKHTNSTVNLKVGFVIIKDNASLEEYIYPSQHVLFIHSTTGA